MDSQQIKQINSLRFSWHEKVLNDPALRKYPIALTLAGYIMHRFDSARGFAELSLKAIARGLSIQKKSVIRARGKLIQRGWLQMLEPNLTGNGVKPTTRYSLSGGPDDLLLEHHETTMREDEASDTLPLYPLPSTKTEK